MNATWFGVLFLVALGLFSAIVARNRWAGKYGLKDFNSNDLNSDFSESWLRLASCSLPNALAFNCLAIAYIAAVIVNSLGHSWIIWLVLPFLLIGAAGFVVFGVLVLTTFVSNKPSLFVPKNLRNRQLNAINFGLWFMGPRPKQ